MKPRKEFIKNLKNTFLENFDNKFSVTKPSISRIKVQKHVLRYSFFAILLLLFASGGMLALADQIDLAPSHPLYALKKASENIQLQLSADSNKAELHEKFAQKRLKEISNLKNSSDNKDIDSIKKKDIDKLENEFNEQIDSSLDKIETIENISQSSGSGAINKNGEKDKKSKLCESISKAIEEHNKLILENSVYKKDFPKLEEYCGKILGKSDSK